LFERGLRFVRLLAGPDEVLDSFRGFRSLALLELVHPPGDRGNHIGRSLALIVSRGPSRDFLLHTLFTLDDFYYFLFWHISIGLNKAAVRRIVAFLELN
jgi:hypothetical protein